MRRVSSRVVFAATVTAVALAAQVALTVPAIGKTDAISGTVTDFDEPVKVVVLVSQEGAYWFDRTMPKATGISVAADGTFSFQNWAIEAMDEKVRKTCSDDHSAMPFQNTHASTGVPFDRRYAGSECGSCHWHSTPQV